MLIGVSADDFTGASDIANTQAKGIAPDGGLATAQFPGIPDGPAPDWVEAVAQSLAALDWQRAQGCKQVILKYCSTLVSTAEGNIGPVGEDLAEAMGRRGTIVCQAYPATGSTVYQGHLFVFDPLLSEKGMESHPLTLMTGPDLRRFLALQCQTPVGHAALKDVLKGPQ